MDPIITRPSLGQNISLGCLYDARRDRFLNISLLKSTLPNGAIETAKQISIDIKYSKSEKFKDKASAFGLSHELGASVLAGLAQVEGSGRHLTTVNDDDRVAQATMYYSINTTHDWLRVNSQEIKNALAFQLLQSDTATHVVTNISWGAHCVVTAKQQVRASQIKDEVATQLEEKLKGLKTSQVVEEKDDGDEDDDDKTIDMDLAENKTDFTISCDILAEDCFFYSDLTEVQDALNRIHSYIEQTNDGKGMPITYTLTPLRFMEMSGVIKIKKIPALTSLDPECLGKFVRLFDNFLEARQHLMSYHRRLQGHEACVPAGHQAEISSQLRAAKSNEEKLRKAYCRLLRGTRAGDTPAENLWTLLKEHTDSKNKKSPQSLSSITTFVDDMDFMDLVMSKGASYVGYKTGNLKKLLDTNHFEEAYVFFFNQQTRKKSPAWNTNYDLLTDLLSKLAGPHANYLVIVVNCDATKTSLDHPYITYYRHHSIITEDLVDHRKMLSSNCVMRYDPENLNSNSKEKPLKRRTVKMACPNLLCDQSLKCTWICNECQGVVEYGFIDNRLYCECGSCHYSHWQFKCQDDDHGECWAKCEDEQFEKVLKMLEPMSELNILILGETGVGKSTWINAFVNYIAHDTLDHAIEACAEGELKWVVPCSFSTQTTEADGKFVQKDIRLGSNTSEEDGSSGKSATQCTKVYATEMGNIRVRLIDTPGIGDTRGYEKDNENMVDILRVLRAYDRLHGILILLKPNAARLTVMFRFCVKQLLTHLHRNAAQNIVFGFTNTRGSNYKPGDTFKPLESLLKEYKEVEMGLYKHNVYCFDSESFRYLAAQKRGVDMGYVEDNRRSWEYSVGECKRLVHYFEGLKPHEIRSTINLNETRTMILRMTEPMALLSQKIQTTIDLNQEEIHDLRSRELTREELSKKLYIQKQSLEAVPVNEPRTVCANSNCVEIRSDLQGMVERTIIYKTFCHTPCYLRGVPSRTKGDPSLQHCMCVGPDGLCRVCGHTWGDHMHIYIEYVPKTYRIADTAVEKDLGANASEIELRKKAISLRENKIQEFKLEFGQMEEAAIQFGFFLKRHAITPYNDATVEYLDFLIDQEKMKVGQGGDAKKLKTLQQNRQNFLQKVKILTEAISRGENYKVLDDRGVHGTINCLYSLPNFGQDLRDMVDNNEKAAEACYREQTFQVSRRRPYGKKNKAKAARQDMTETLDLKIIEEANEPEYQSQIVPTQNENSRKRQWSQLGFLDSVKSITSYLGFNEF